MPPPPLQLIAMHGWGGNAANWTPWRLAWAERPWRWHFGERGYGGGSTRTPSWGPDGRRVVLAHSLGPHLLPREVLAAAEAVVLLASFGRFVPPGRGGRRLQVALDGMAAALADAPDESTASARAQAMLRAFLARAAAPDPVALLPSGPADQPVGPLGRLRLRQDLARLVGSTGLPTGWPLGVPVLLVEAGADGIVDPEAQALLRLSLPQAERLVFPEAGHALLRADLIPAVLEWLLRTLSV
ncbi:MAG: alpha/beta hydrolase [Synechococcaceae cyanobacterium]|jgi:pimeloyl-[acyl-carrier protein] methyl ester esterase